MKIELTGNEIAKMYTAIDKVGETGITMSSLLVAHSLQLVKKGIETIFNAINILGKQNKEYIEYHRKRNAIQRDNFDDHKKMKDALLALSKKYSAAIEQEEIRVDKFNEELERKFEIDIIPIKQSDLEGTTAEAAAFIGAIFPILEFDNNTKT